MKKIVVLIIFLFLVTGCSVEYRLVINEDLSITEKAKLTGTSDFFAEYYKTTKKTVLNTYLDIYGTMLEENKYTYELVNESTPYVNVERKYDNIKTYTEESILISNYFDEVKYTENGDILRIETSGYNKGSLDDNQDRFYLRELTISIKCPYKVKNHNAKDVNKENNTYIFELKDDGDKIILEFDKTRKFNPNESIIKTILTMVAIAIACWVAVFVINKKNK